MIINIKFKIRRTIWNKSNSSTLFYAKLKFFIYHDGKFNWYQKKKERKGNGYLTRSKFNWLWIIYYLNYKRNEKSTI